MLRRGYVSSLCALLLGIGGCPKRQETRRNTIVYVQAPAPAPAPAAEPSATKPQEMVIEEPPPPAPEPEETPPPPTPEPAPPHRSRHAPHPETPPEPDENPASENPETQPAEVPALEPRQSTAQETELRHQYLNLEQDIRQRLARLNGAQLSTQRPENAGRCAHILCPGHAGNGERRSSRALNLATKASLLLAALE